MQCPFFNKSIDNQLNKVKEEHKTTDQKVWGSNPYASIISFNVNTKRNLNPSLFSKILGKGTSEAEHFIDWDISLAVLNQKGKLLNQDCFIFYNNLNYNNDIISLRGDSIIIDPAPEFDEELIVNFNKLPKEAYNLVFYLSNHQKINFETTEIEIQIENIPNISDKQFKITNSTTCNAIELFKFQKCKNNIWDIVILNSPFTDSNGLEQIVKSIVDFNLQ